jgi:hypothetical protein
VSVSRYTEGIGAESNTRRRWTDFCEGYFFAEIRFLDLEYLTVSLLLRPHTKDTLVSGIMGSLTP